MPVNNEIYRGYDESDQHLNMNLIKNMPNNIMGNIRKNSGNLNGVSADNESSDSDHEYFVYKIYLIGLLRIKIFIMRIFKQFNLVFTLKYSFYLKLSFNLIQ